jgi:hypothetical protein
MTNVQVNIHADATVTVDLPKQGVRPECCNVHIGGTDVLIYLPADKAMQLAHQLSNVLSQLELTPAQQARWDAYRDEHSM